MKQKIYNIGLCLMVSIILTSCVYDNYSSPSITFSGRIVYQGTPIGVKSSSGHDVNNANVYFNLYEPGWQKSNMPIRVVVNQDGSFSSSLFGADYKLSMPSGVGPYIASGDSTDVSLNGNKTMDIEVTPYYMINKPSYSMLDSIVTATFGIDKIITDARAQNIQAVYLYINRLLITDDSNNIASTQLDGGNITNINAISMQVKMPSLASLGLGISTTQTTIFARIGVRINNVNSMLFSPVEEITIR